MIKTRGYAARSAKSPLVPFTFMRREPGPHEVLIEVLYSGICHSDIHQARNEWGGSLYPMVPGHEIVGRVSRVGSRVKRFNVGDIAGVGCFTDSCRRCVSCREGEEQYCEGSVQWTYNATEKDGKTRTYGGYSQRLTVDENYALRVPRSIPVERAAPLLCAGITTYSPLRHFGVKRAQKVGVVGMGGLGHMAVKIAASLGAEVTVFSTSEDKKRDALRFGAKRFVATRGRDALAGLARSQDFLLDTVSAKHDLDAYLELVKRDGRMVIVGVPEKPLEIRAFSLIIGRKSLSGSVIGGIRQTQEMLDYCARHRIAPEVEIIPARKINAAFERTLKADVRYRFVIDAKTF
ncbi:MAG: NADP-dependent alcohol dehydrogenase C 1 [Candidatus Omnitrophica bacterium]|nr:NADP-dependent alcohol dehydrogenase C 1 [Candidatus Omnitrophota bacterium]